jgi:hypothetical protein
VIILNKIKYPLFRCNYLIAFISIFATVSIKAQFYNLPNEYFVDIKVVSDRNVDTYKRELQFQIVNKK